MHKKKDSRKLNVIDMAKRYKHHSERSEHRKQECLGQDDTAGDTQLSHMLDNFVVPSVPPRFVSRVMEEADNRIEKPQEQPWCLWKKNYWAAWQSSTRIAACLAVVMACTVGMMFENGIDNSDEQNLVSIDNTVLYGFEWLGAATPGAITSVYVTIEHSVFSSEI